MNEPEAESTRSRRFAPALTLLFIAILVNYVDRGNLSIAAPLLKDELGISASQLGILFSAFFWSYTALQFVSGWLVDRFDASFVIAGGYLIWSLATSATGIVHGFAMLAFMRLLLGVGESVAFPCCSKLLAQHLPESSRGFANGWPNTILFSRADTANGNTIIPITHSSRGKRRRIKSVNCSRNE